MTPDLLKGLNQHLTLEFRAAHEYLAMAIWLAEHDLPGFAKWMAQQSADERMHAQRIIDHLVERDQKVKLPSVAASKAQRVSSSLSYQPSNQQPPSAVVP